MKTYSARRTYNVRPWQERFWEKVDKSGDCWLWTAGRFGAGYGMFYMRGDATPRGAHRIAFALCVRQPLADEVIRHTCDNPPCCNPAHLIVGTHLDNMKDMAERKRAKRGQHNKIKTQCKNGHPFTDENTLVRANGWRSCKACNRINVAQHYERKRQSQEPTK